MSDEPLMSGLRIFKKSQKMTDFRRQALPSAPTLTHAVFYKFQIVIIVFNVNKGAKGSATTR